MNAKLLIDVLEKRFHTLIPRAQKPLYTAARYALFSPGKRLRPLLMFSTAEIFAIDPFTMIDCACALEMIHTYSLIHDDLPCMDNDDFRRGKPTLHKVFGEAMALLTGDYLLTFAFEVLAKIPHFSADQRLQLIDTLAHAAGCRGMIGGQATDITATKKTLSKTQLLTMHKRKTAALFTAALQFGAIIGNAPPAVRSSFEQIGTALGLAYQLFDDLQDVEETHSAAEKVTAVTLLGLNGTARQAHLLQSSIQKLCKQLPVRAIALETLINNILQKNCVNCNATRKCHA